MISRERTAALTIGGLAHEGKGRPDMAVGSGQEALLLERCRRGDLGALRTLYESEVSSVRRIARRMGLTSGEELDDVTQDVFSMVFRDIARVRSGELSAWLFRLTSNRVNDRHRRRRVRDAFRRTFGLDGSDESVPGPEQSLLRNDARLQVSRILARMPQKKREVFVLFELEEVPGEEIAARLGIPLGTVWTRLHHARQEFARIARLLQRRELMMRGRP
jgi:RNA polymerase sigma-70 factor (ECF subfamily)